MELVPACDPGLLPRWHQAIADHAGRSLAGRPRSWDCYQDVFAPAYDTVRDSVGDAIALVVAFVEYMSGEPLEPDARRLIALGVRSHGKAFLYGLNEGLGATDEWSPRAWYLYARACARRAGQAR